MKIADAEPRPDITERDWRPWGCYCIVGLVFDDCETASSVVRLVNLWRDLKDGAIAVRLGEVWNPEAFGKHFARLVKAAKLGHVRLHDLRHSCASLMLKGDEHIKVVPERLGHAKVSTTLDLYSHVMPGMPEAAAARLGGVLKATRGAS